MRLHLFGASGSGCSSLGDALAKRLDLAFFDTDDFFWETTTPPFTVLADPQKRNESLLRALQQNDGWVLAGSISNWNLELESLFSLAIFVRLPTEVRMGRLEEREAQRYSSRVLPGGDLYDTSQAFLTWSRSYDTGELPGRTLAQHTAWYAALPCPKIDLLNVGHFDQTVEWLVSEVRALSPGGDIRQDVDMVRA